MKKDPTSSLEQIKTLENRVNALEMQIAADQVTIQTLGISGGNRAFRTSDLLFAYSLDIILFVRMEDGRILDANAAAMGAYGYSHAELVSLTTQDLRAPETPTSTTQQIGQANEGEILFETIHRRKDGNHFPVEVSSRGAIIDDQHILIHVIRDITERKQAEMERTRLMAEIEQERNDAVQRAVELHAIIEAMQDPVLVYDRKGVIYLANTSAVQAHGFDPSRHHRNETNRTLAVHRPDGSLVQMDELPSARALRGETVIGAPMTVTNAAGREMDFLITSTPLIVNGLQIGAVSVWHEVTEQKKAEQALQLALEQAEEGRLLLEALLAFVPEGISITGGPPDFVIQRVSRYGLEMAGDQASNGLLGVPAGQHQYTQGIFQPDGQTYPAPEQMPLYRAGHFGEIVQNEEMVFRTKTGAPIPILINAAPIRDAQGNIVAAINTWRDFAERKRMEEQLREARDQAAWIASLPDQNPNPVLRVSAEGMVLYPNRSARELPGWKCAEGEPLPQPLFRLVEQTMVAGGPVQQDVPLGERFYSILIMPFAEKDYTNLYGIDITEQEQTQQALEASRQRINDILKSVGDALFALDREWAVIYINDAAAQIAGRPAAQLIGKTLWELWPALLGTPLEKCYRQAMDAGSPGQIRVAGSQSGRWYDVSVYPSSEGITVFYVDRTNQELAEETQARLLAENQRQRELLQTVINVDPSGIAVFTRQDLRFQLANPAYRSFTPMPERDPVGKTLDEVWPPALGFTAVETYLSPQTEGKAVIHEKLTRRYPDGALRHFRIHVYPIRWEGQPAMLLVLWETTQLEQAKESLATYAEQLSRSNQDLQNFAFIASHDLQEPLRKIQVFGQSLLESADQLDERQRNYIERMQNAARRMQEMVNGLLQLSRVNTQGQPFEPVDLSQLTSGVLSDLDYQIRRTGGKVDVGLLPIIDGDPLQIRQLLQNLIGNALKYHRPNTPPVVTISARQDQNSVQIEVADQGIGFNPAETERIFQPFQRLVGRSEFEGSGMGLAICRRIVERHSGEITAQSKAGEGSTFTVTLPRHQQESQ